MNQATDPPKRVVAIRSETLHRSQPRLQMYWLQDRSVWMQAREIPKQFPIWIAIVKTRTPP
jgi:hypothetical protein